MRCNSSGDLYPITTRPPNKTFPPSTFVVLSMELWHNRLGHPGSIILSSLHRDNFLECNKSQNNYFCNSFPLGKQIKLLFYSSVSHTFIPFDIVHSGLWTSSILSSEVHHYYVLFLDDYIFFYKLFQFIQNLRFIPFFFNLELTLKHNLKEKLNVSNVTNVVLHPLFL